MYNELLPWHKFLDKGLLKHFVPPVTIRRISNISNLLNIFQISFLGIFEWQILRNKKHLTPARRRKIENTLQCTFGFK